MALLQLTMIPVGAGVSVGEYVVEIQKRLEKEGATFRLNDMGTIIEGEVPVSYTHLTLPTKRIV